MPVRHDQLTRRLRPLRRAVLRHRRALAALLAAVAVASGLHQVLAPPPPLVSVAVAARDLPGGSVVTLADLTTAEFAPGSVPDALAEDPVGRTLAAPMRRGEPVTDVRLVAPSLTLGQSGVVAVPVRLPDSAMAALLRVGDRIDLIAADPRGSGARVVARDVPVLALPTDGEDRAALGLPGRLVIVGTSESGAVELAAASVESLLTISLAR